MLKVIAGSDYKPWYESFFRYSTLNAH